jgi:hypothetical protein
MSSSERGSKRRPRKRRRNADGSDEPRSRRDATAEAVDAESDVDAHEARPFGSDRAQGDKPKSGVPAGTIWALLAGLGVGYIAGREVSLSGSGPATGEVAAADASAASSAAAPTGSGKVYKSESEFPAGWTKEADVRAGFFTGLTAAQKATVLHALNERNCECGCSFGTLSNCLAKDPGCPRSPKLGKLAIDLAKQGKSAFDIMAAIDKEQGGLNKGGKPAAAPTGPVYIELAAYNPRIGPANAKVTVVEFSDFQ